MFRASTVTLVHTLEMAVFSPVPIAHDDDGVVLVLGGFGEDKPSASGVFEDTQVECLRTELVCLSLLLLFLLASKSVGEKYQLKHHPLQLISFVDIFLTNT